MGLPASQDGWQGLHHLHRVQGSTEGGGQDNVQGLLQEALCRDAEKSAVLHHQQGRSDQALGTHICATWLGEQQDRNASCQWHKWVIFIIFEASSTCLHPSTKSMALQRCSTSSSCCVASGCQVAMTIPCSFFQDGDRCTTLHV